MFCEHSTCSGCYCKCHPIYQHPDYWIIHIMVKGVIFNLEGSDTGFLIENLKKLTGVEYELIFPNAL